MASVRDLYLSLGFKIDESPLQKVNRMTDAFIKKFEGLTKPIENFGKKFDSITDTAVKNMNRTTTAIAGATDSVYEHNQNLSKVRSTYTTLGSIINGYVTPALFAMGAGIAFVGSQYSEMSNKFQAQTLASDKNMGRLNQSMRDTLITTGASFGDVGQTFSYLRNQLRVTDKNLQGATETAFLFSNVWSNNDAQYAIESYSGLKVVMDELKVSQARASDMFAVALRNNQGDVQKATEEILKQEKAYKKATAAGGKFANAYEEMIDSFKGPFETFGEGFRNLRDGIQSIYKGMEPSLQKIANGFLKISETIKGFLQNNPAFAAFVGNFILFGSIITIAAGGLMVFTGFLMTVAKNAPKLAKNFNFMLRATAGLPRMLASLMPIVLQGFMALPGLVAKFAWHFVRLNPALSAFMLAGYLIQRNWEKFEPVITRIGDKLQEAFTPLIEKFKELGNKYGPKIEALFNKLADFSADGLLKAIKILEPGIIGFAKLISGDLQGAWDGFKKSFKLMDENMFGPHADGISKLGTAIAIATAAWGTYKTVVGIVRVAQWGLNIAMAANPIGLVIVGIGALIAIGYELYNHWETVRAKAKELWNSMGALKFAIAALAGPWGILIGLGLELILNWDEVKASAQIMAINTSKAFVQMKLSALEGFKGIMDAAKPIMSLLPDGVAKAFNSMQSSISSSIAQAKADIASLNGQKVTIETQLITTRLERVKQQIISSGGKPDNWMIRPPQEHAEGGIFNKPHFGVFAEAGPEAFIPLRDKKRGLEVWRQTGKALGVAPDLTVPSGDPIVTPSRETSQTFAPNISIYVQGSATNQETGQNIKAAVKEALNEFARDVMAARPNLTVY